MIKFTSTPCTNVINHDLSLQFAQDASLFTFAITLLLLLPKPWPVSRRDSGRLRHSTFLKLKFDTVNFAFTSRLMIVVFRFFFFPGPTASSENLIYFSFARFMISRDRTHNHKPLLHITTTETKLILLAQSDSSVARPMRRELTSNEPRHLSLCSLTNICVMFCLNATHQSWFSCS